MKKLYLTVVCLLGVFIGFSFTQRVNAEILPVVGNPYAFDLELEFEKTVSGEAHTLGLTTSGQLYAWGWNLYGQLGIGTTTSSNIAIDITGYLNLNSGEFVTDIAAGVNHSSVITSEGRLLIWGYNVYGAIGDGTTIDKLSPIDITPQFVLDSGETIVYSENGYYFSGAITSNGRVFTWGQGYSGQLGNGDNIDIYTPVEITNNFSLLPEEIITRLLLGSAHSAAITSLGRVFTWGYNATGELGDGTTINKNIPTDITANLGLATEETIMDLEAFYHNTGIVTSLGRILMWGQNSNGTIGDGTYIYKANPTDITANCNLGLEEKIIDLSLGIGHAGVLTSNNRVLMWGLNNYYQLGDGTNVTKNLPVDITTRFVLNPGEVNTEIRLGGYMSATLTSNSRSFSWGNNNVGQLGDGTNTIKSAPTRLKPLRYTITENFLPVSETIIKAEAGDNFSAVITASHRLFMFGWNAYGQLGTGNTIKSMPVDITANFNLAIGEVIEDIYLGGTSALAITSSGRIFTWGQNVYGQLADGTNVNKSLPVDVSANFSFNEFETIEQVTLASENGFILTSEKRVFAWGYNAYGQLGDGTTSHKYLPIDVTSHFPLEVGETVESIVAGSWHTGAYTSLNRLFTWGRNDYGQLGDATLVAKYTPNDITSQIGLLPGETFTDISFWFLSSMVLTSNGRVLNWGRNAYGQLGDGTTVDKNYPVEITTQFALEAGETIVDVETAGEFSAAMSSLQKVFLWGYNLQGQIGDGTTIEKHLPVDITSRISLMVGESIARLSLGNLHTALLTSNGRMFEWGNNSEYQLGFSTGPVLSPYELNKLYSYNNEMILSYVDALQNHLFGEYKFTILPKYQIRDEIVSVRINGIEYTNFTNVNGRIDVYIPNIWTLNEKINLTIEAITFSNDNVMTVTGNTSALLILVEDTYAPVITFAYENDLYIEEGIGSLDYLAATALDDTSEVITVIITENIDWYLPGEYLVTYSASDISGNTSTRDRTVYIMGDISVDGTVYYDMTFYYFEPDIYIPGSSPSGQIVRYNEINYFSSTDNSSFSYLSGWNEVPYEFIIDNRLVIASVPVYSDDSTPPVFDFIDSQYIEAGLYEGFDWTTIVTGAVDNTLTTVTLIETLDEVIYNTVGAYNVTIRAVDTSGNFTEQTFVVNVTDFTPPELNLSEITYEAGSIYDFDYLLYVTDNAVGTIFYTELSNDVQMNIPGTYTVSYEIYDLSLNVNSGSFTVNIIDTTAPSFTIIDQSISVGIYDSLWPFLEGVLDNSAQPLLYLEVAGFIDYNQKGIYSVTVRLSDGYGNYSDQEVIITVIDDLAPTFEVLDQVKEVGEYGIIDWTLYIENIQDNYWEEFVLLVEEANVVTTTLGVYPVTVSVTDLDGNYLEKTFNVIIVDTEKPIIHLTGATDIYLDYPQTYLEPGAICLDYYDACSVVITGTVNTNALGTYVLSYNASDSSGNIADTVTRTIYVVDRIPPEIVMNGSSWIYLEVGNAYIEPGAYVIDNYGMDSQVLISGEVDINVVGTYFLYYDAVDMFGNVAPTINRIVSVIDTTPPEFSISNQVIEVGKYTWIDWVAYVEDIQDNYSVVFDKNVLFDGVDYESVGTYPVTVSVTDQDGNMAVEEFYVSVVDLTPPDFTVTNHTIEAGDYLDIDWSQYALDIVDNYSIYFTYQEVLDFVNYQASGVYLVKVKVIDESGNFTEKTMDITVVDTTAPDFIINSQTIEAGLEDIDWTLFIEAAWDNANGDLIFTETLDEVDYNTPGVYQVEVTVTDQDGNLTTKGIDVIVIDTTPPVYNITIEAGLDNIDWTDLITDISDNSDGLLLAYEVEDNIIYNLPGIYLVIVSVIDESDNETFTNINVTVRDTVAPVVYLNPSLDTIKQGSGYLENGVSVTDVTDYEVVIQGEVNSEIPGVYELVYQVIDTSGNVTLVKRYVTVYPETPVISFILGNALTTVKLGDEYLDGICTVNINGSEYSCEVKSNNVDTNVAGIYTVTYSYSYLGKEYTYKRYVFVYDDNETLSLYLPIWKRDEDL